MRPNGRSADFIAPSTSNGCAMACAYCYVPRRKGLRQPDLAFRQRRRGLRRIARHAGKLGPKREPNQIDPVDWVYDIGENGDLSVDALLSDNVRPSWRCSGDAARQGRLRHQGGDRELLGYEPAGRTRIRFSLMPERVARIVDVRTSPMADRIAAIDDFVRAGYEVHVNFSPGDPLPRLGGRLPGPVRGVDAALSAPAKRQLKAEIILPDHNAALHEVNMAWHPKAEDWLWTPEIRRPRPARAAA